METSRAAEGRTSAKTSRSWWDVVMRECARLYFAPLTGAVREIQAELELTAIRRRCKLRPKNDRGV